MTTGKTARAGYQAGARKTFEASPGALWAAVLSAAGQRALGSTAALTKTTEGVTTFVGPATAAARAHYRRRIAGGLLQVRVLPATGGRATLALHLEHLADAEARERGVERLRGALERFARLL